MTLATFMGQAGLFPSHETIAKACNRSERTVIRALERAYELGLVVRTRRMALQGGKKVRTSNLYRLIVTASEQARAAGKHMARAVWRSVSHLTDKMADKVTKDISSPSFGRRYPVPQDNPRSRNELLAIIESWQT
uniref:helix-turn-helix domain-containing protein n=1 Tax=Acetobacter aceti TaxID=435 RepID=UPI002D21EC63|nr:helix-turn-helix domain-containing protein [Acetobacter aceti]